MNEWCNSKYSCTIMTNLVKGHNHNNSQDNHRFSYAQISREHAMNNVLQKELDRYSQPNP